MAEAAEAELDSVMGTLERDERVSVRQVEEEASAWLCDHRPAAAGTEALLAAFLTIPYLCDRGSHHAEYVAGCEQMLATTFRVGGTACRPPPALPAGPPDCACADLSKLTLQRVHLSGSVREGTDVRLFDEEVSDMDVMFELGPLHVLVGGSGGGCGGPPPPLVTWEDTPQPGFVLLRHWRLPDCRHSAELLLSGGTVVTLMDALRQALTASPAQHSGPALATSVRGLFRDPKDIDLVACVLCDSWPCEDFGSRPRRSGQPNADLVQRLCRTPIFLVPVGYPGSDTEQHEWRMSFSRHEYVVYRSMSEAQKAVFNALKHCRAVVGEPAKPLKSYYLKTALMWMCEERPVADWSREHFHASLLAVLRYIEVCVRHAYMPLYFWPEVNVLSSRSSRELAALAEAVTVLRRRLLSSALALLADWLGAPVVPLADRLLLAGQPLSESEFWQQYARGAVRDLSGGQQRRPLAVLRDLTFGGKLRPHGRLLPFPVCSSLALGVEAARVLGDTLSDGAERNKQLGEVTGWVEALLPVLHQLTERQRREDNWLVDEDGGDAG